MSRPDAKSLALLLSFTCVASHAWAADPAPGTFGFHESQVLGTSLDLTIIATTQKDADAAHDATLAEIERLRKILSTYDATSDLGKLNATRDPVKVAPEVIEVLQQYDQWMKNTKGAYSGRIGELVALWKKAEKDNALPTKDAISAVLAEMKKPLWKIDAKAGTVQRLSDALINIDSLGKGYIVSKAAALVHTKMPAIRGLMLNVGGDITTVGTSSATAIEPWSIGIADPAHPADNAAPLTTLKLAGLSVATSGGYARGYTILGKTYSHLLDPRTGYPVDFDAKKNPKGVASATVVARDNSTANALATSMNVMTVDEGMALVNATLGAEAMIVLNDGTQVRSNGFKHLETGKLDGSKVADPWNGFSVNIPLVWQGGRERPYVAVWIENAQGQYVTTLAEWGNNQKYLRNLSSWMRSVQGVMNQIMGITRATRAAGNYLLAWDGKDQTGAALPAGTYKVFVEFAYEHNGHSVSSAAIACTGDAATATIRGTQHFADIPITYTKK